MRHALLVATVGVLVAGAAAVAAHSASNSTVSSIALRPAQVGDGYELKLRPDTNCVKGCVTLDMCGYGFMSEVMRTARYQVDYVKDGGIPISNEVVQYTPGGAKEALHEITTAATKCPKKAVKSSVAGVGLIAYRVKRLTDRHLLPGYLAMQIHVSGKASGQKVDGTLISIYQAKGNFLSGVYTEIGTDAPLTDLIQLALHAAEGSAQNLNKYA